MSGRIEREVDGGILTFPEGTPDEVVERAVEAFHEAEAEAEAEREKRRPPHDRQMTNPGRDRTT